MPIETNSGNIDFAWRFKPTNEGQDAIVFSLRLHQTDEYGWTLSFLNESNEPISSLPASLFNEVSDHIIQYMSPRPSGLSPVPGLRLPGAALAMPQINRPAATVAPVAPSFQRVAKNQNVDQVRTRDGKVFEATVVTGEEEFEPEEGVYLPSGHDPDEILKELGEDTPVFQSFSNQTSTVKEKVDDLSKDERKAILEERQMAKANPNVKEGLKPIGIKKRHSDLI